MKIFIPHSPNVKTGKGFFCNRLHSALQEMGAKVCENISDRHDISLHPIKLYKTKSKRVIRLDGCYHNSMMNYKAMNKTLAKNLHAADAVVYQSLFSKQLCNKYLGKFNGPKTIISNGASISYYNSIPHTIENRLFMASARWRPHKRLMDIIKSFLLADLVDSKLIIAGDVSRSGLHKGKLKNYFNLPNIEYIGKTDQKTLASYLKSSVGFIHLCWFDNCPNGVVEAIAALVPVICNNVGGTAEIVRPSGGIVCDVDKPYNLKPVRLYKPPSIDRNKIADALRTCWTTPPRINADHINISSVAQKYLEFFKVAMKGS